MGPGARAREEGHGRYGMVTGRDEVCRLIRGPLQEIEEIISDIFTGDGSGEGEATTPEEI